MRKVCGIMALAGVLIAGYAGAQSPAAGALMGSVWYLAEVKTPERVVEVNRAVLKADGMEDVFSLRFAGENRVSGKGAPNTYTAECVWGADLALRIGAAAATRMFAFKEPEALKESAFFSYLADVRRYGFSAGGSLELYSGADKNGRRTTLVFVKDQ